MRVRVLSTGFFYPLLYQKIHYILIHCELNILKCYLNTKAYLQMPKKFFKRWLPDAKIVKNNKTLRMFGKLLHDPNLWHLNRRSVPRAFAIGLFTAFIPIPFQTVLAVGLAIGLRANVLISAALIWVSNPLTMPPIFYFAYKLGAKILGVKPQPLKFELTLEWFKVQLVHIWKPLYLGGFICGIVSAALGYFVVALLWRLMVYIRWRNKKNKLK